MEYITSKVGEDPREVNPISALEGANSMPGGVFPSVGDVLTGDLASYGFKDVYYPSNG